MKTWIKGIGLTISLVGVIFALIPFVGYGILNVGNTVLFLVNGYIGLYLLTTERREEWPTLIRRITNGLLVGALSMAIVFGGLTAMMVEAAYFNEPAPVVEEKTMIILGCKVEGEQPSLTLRYRLDAGYEYLVANPESKCIVTGGLGEGKSHTESEVMKGYLVNRGIARDRIYEEDQARNTYENIEYSLALIEEQQLSDDIVIVTSDFHQYRAGLNLNQHGIQYEGISGKMPWGLIPTYWTREYIAILRDILFYA